MSVWDLTTALQAVPDLWQDRHSEHDAGFERSPRGFIL